MRFANRLTLLRADLLSVEKTAEYFGCSPKTIRRAIDAGEVEIVRVGRCVRIPVSEIGRLREFAQPAA